MPFLTLYLFKHTQLSITSIGLVVGLQPLALCFGSVIGGYISDNFKRHIILMLSLFISSLVYLGFYFTAKYLILIPQMIAFAILSLLNGFCSALFSPTSRAIISETAQNAKENVKFLHLRYMALNLGAALGPLVGAYAGIAGNIQAFLITSLLYFSYMIILIFTFRNYSSEKAIPNNNGITGFVAALKELLKNRLFITLLLSLTIFNILYVQLSSNLALVINKSVIDGTIFFSWMLSLNAILVVVLQPIIYFVIKNRNQYLVIACGFSIMIVCSFLLIFLPIGKLSIIFFVVSLTIAELLIFPTSSILVAEITPEKTRGTAFGAIDLEYLGSAVGPATGGLLIQYFAINGFFIGMFLISCLCLITYLPCLNLRNKSQHHL
ncbi:MAG: MFS transporter [Burkholderiales bacterium]|nr:MFS transporter [Burkholderiales bacterium]